MSDFRIVHEFLFGTQPSNIADKRIALHLARECPTEVAWIGAAVGKLRGPDGTWA
jgi:hypothetical protein